MTRLIFEKIPLIMGEIGAVAKSHKNMAQNYAFRGIDDVLQAAQPVMAKHGVFSVPRVLSSVTEERTSKNGGPLIFRILTVRSRFYATDGSFFDAVTIGEGCDSGDKASNKAMSAAEKYALVEVFKIPTQEPKDSEHDSHDIRARDPREIMEQQVRAGEEENKARAARQTAAERKLLEQRIGKEIIRIKGAGGNPGAILGLQEKPVWASESIPSLELYLELLEQWRPIEKLLGVPDERKL